MASQSYNFSSGSSTPIVMDTAQSDWGLQLSKLLSALGQNQYNWAMQQFNRGSGITDQNINQYMELAGKGAGLAQTLLSRYENVFAPLMDEYVRMAGSYNSAERQRFMMGRAESTVAQSMQAGRDAAERRLQGFGINPNSGRYQDLILSSRTADAAARAGAGNEAQLNVAAAGRQMTEKAAQMGQNVPGMTVNALQSAYTGITGAQNAILGLLNTGANLAASAAPFFNAAASAIKMPPIGNRTQQQSSGGNNNEGGGGGNKGQGAGPGAGQGGAGQGAGGGGQYRPMHQPGGGQQPAGRQYPMGPAGQARPAILNDLDKREGANNGTGDGTSSDEDRFDPGTGGQVATPFDDRFSGMSSEMFSPEQSPWATQPGGQLDTNIGQNPDGSTMTPENAPWSDPLEGQQFDASLGNQGGVGDWQDQTQQWGQQGTYGGAGAWGGDWGTNPLGDDQTGSTGGGDGGGYGGYQDFGQQSQQDYSDQSGNWQSSSYGGGSYSGGYDGTGGGGYQQQGQYEGNYGYAAGGRVREQRRGAPIKHGASRRGGQGVLPTSGGQVPRGASPSRGRQTDDVSARLNAGEFVVPRDVVQDHGTKFFRNLIEKSRRARTGMAGPPAQPKMKPALRLKPSFASQPMGRGM